MELMEPYEDGPKNRGHKYKVDELVDRMVVVGTIEEKILELQKTKKDLVSTLISEEKTALKDFKSEEIMKLFER